MSLSPSPTPVGAPSPAFTPSPVGAPSPAFTPPPPAPLPPGVYSPARKQDLVKVYENSNKGGTSASFDRVGRFNISNDSSRVNDSSISSIDVLPGYKVEALKAGQKPGNTGTQMFTGYTANIPSGWNDKIDEIVIYKAPPPPPPPPPPSPVFTPAPSAPAPIALVTPPSPKEGSSWWIWLIVAIILILLGVGVYMFTKKPAAPPVNAQPVNI